MAAPPGSRSSRSISVATLKVALGAQEVTQSSACAHRARAGWTGGSSDSDRREAKLKFLLPPSALKPAATAMASANVDFPLPFSPDEEGDLGVQLERLQRVDGRDVERVRIERLHLLADQRDRADIRVESLCRPLSAGRRAAARHTHLSRVTFAWPYRAQEATRYTPSDGRETTASAQQQSRPRLRDPERVGCLFGAQLGLRGHRHERPERTGPVPCLAIVEELETGELMLCTATRSGINSPSAVGTSPWSRPRLAPSGLITASPLAGSTPW